LSTPTKRTGSFWARVMFRNVKMNVATIGKSVNARNPMIHGEMKRYPWRASRRARGVNRGQPHRRRSRAGQVEFDSEVSTVTGSSSITPGS
jgi:hypothetical protein